MRLHGQCHGKRRFKIGLALEAVAAAEHIEASEDEINAEIKRIADQYKMEEDKVRELINLEDLKQDLARTKAIDFIKSHANIVEKPAEADCILASPEPWSMTSNSFRLGWVCSSSKMTPCVLKPCLFATSAEST